MKGKEKKSRFILSKAQFPSPLSQSKCLEKMLTVVTLINPRKNRDCFKSLYLLRPSPPAFSYSSGLCIFAEKCTPTPFIKPCHIFQLTPDKLIKDIKHILNMS